MVTICNLNEFYPVKSDNDGLLVICDDPANVLIYATSSTDIEPRLVKAIYTSNLFVKD